MTRVLFDAHQLGRRQTGNETYVRELLSGLVNQPDLEVIPLVEDRDSANYLTKKVRTRRIPRNGVLRLAAMSLLARSERVDVLHAIYFLPPSVRRPTVVTVHDISFERFPQFFSRRSLIRDRLLIRASAKAASRVVTVSETSRLDIINEYGMDADRVVAIPNGVGPCFAPSASWTPFRGGRPLRVLGVGTLQPRKNLRRLVEAVRMVGREIPISLRIVGPDGFEARRFREEVSGRHGIALVGWQSDEALAKEYQAADVFVYPSIYEGFGLPVVEAMASGTPVVSSTGGALTEVANEAALLVDPLDTTAIAAAIRRIATEVDLAAELRARGIARAAQYSWARSAALHADVYREAAGR